MRFYMFAALLHILKARNTMEVKQNMTSKELLYVQDALGHEKFLMEQCKATSEQLQDKELCNYVKKLEAKHDKIFNRLYNLV